VVTGAAVTSHRHVQSRPWVQRAVLILAGLVFAITVGELALRLSYRAPWYTQLLGEQARHERLAYRRNRLGMRDRDYATPKPPSTQRVFVLGDSFTYGIGVTDEAAIFPELLEVELNRTSDTAIEVLNAGVPGSLTGRWLALLENQIAPFDPDVVLVVFFLRDGTRTSALASFFEPIRKDIAARNDASRWYRDVYAYRLLRDALDRRQVAERFAATLNDSYFGTSEQTEEWRAAQQNILRMARITRERSAVMGLAIFPILADLDGDYPFRAICEAIETFAEQHAIPVHNMLPDFQGQRGPELWVSTYDQHPNAQGHAIAARALLPFMGELLSRAEKPPLSGNHVW
jgi:lysophospholipase L1-like esterase